MTHPRSIFIPHTQQLLNFTTSKHQKHRKHPDRCNSQQKLLFLRLNIQVFGGKSIDYNDSSDTATMASPGKQVQTGPFKNVPTSSLTGNVQVTAAKDIPGQFPDPVVIYPQLEHRQTFIILHGRGSTAERFAPPLLEMVSNSGEKLQTAFPHAKLIFLTASRNRATIYKRSLTHQWFDHWHMEEPNKRQDLMRAGLQKSCEYVHGILQQEIYTVEKKNVVLWGLSQGCATSLTSLLTWDGEPFAATVGMCGYLPFANHIEEIAKGDTSSTGDDLFGHEDDDEDPFSHSGAEGDDSDIFEASDSNRQDLPAQAIKFLRNEIDMDGKPGIVFREVPIFLGHGVEDGKVPIELGREVKTCLDLLGADVQMIEYDGLGHWYSEEMLGDIFDFVKDKLRVEDA